MSSHSVPTIILINQAKWLNEGFYWGFGRRMFVIEAGRTRWKIESVP